MKSFFLTCLAAFVGSATTTFAKDLNSVYAGMQDMYAANMNFETQVNAQLNARQQQLEAQQAQFWQNVLRNPEVRAAYQQHLAQGGQSSYEQFAYWYAMTAGGTNVQAAVVAQRRQIEGLREANETVKGGHISYNDSWHKRQGQIDDTMRRYGEGAINGNWYYQNPNTGENYTLPYTSVPGYYTSGNNTFYKDVNGQYYMYSGNGWTQMNMIDR
jgi:hypothetical protein